MCYFSCRCERLYTNGKKCLGILNRPFGGVDILINNAGISIIGLFQDLSRADWMRLMDTNVGSVYNCCHFAIPHMVHENVEKIINIFFSLGIAGKLLRSPCSASKGELLMP